MVLRNSSLRAVEVASPAVTLEFDPEHGGKKKSILVGCSLTYTHLVAHSPNTQKTRNL